MSKGFTLLELLLVITIIMLIASMSLESYYQAKRQAEAVRCKTYRKQMETVQSLMYNECFRCHPSVNDNNWKK